jgi:hypothetical protein
MTDLSDRSFITRPGKPKFDWELVLKGIDRHYRKATNNKRRLALHTSMLEQIAFERDACQTAGNRDPLSAPNRDPSSMPGSAARRVAISERSASPRGEPRAVQQHPEGGLGGG